MRRGFTGRISYENDSANDDRIRGRDNVRASLLSNAGQAELLKLARVTKQQAEKIALAGVPQGRIRSGELEKEDGLLSWSFDIARPGTKNVTEVWEDAKTGKIASLNVETPKDQAKEAAADKAKK